jgi:5-methylcytosine-specific restriction endonuclease McrA
MTNDEQYVYWYSIERKQTLEEIREKMGLSSCEDVKLLRDNNAEIIKKLQRIYTACSQKRKVLISKPDQEYKKEWKDFYNWYEKQEEKHGHKTCCYCGISEDKLDKYFNSNNEQYAQARQRGKYLEIERVETSNGKNRYTDDNMRLSCYVCNNAKSDFLSAKDFEPIARGIHNFWKDKVGIQDIVFPTEVYETFK